MTDLWPEDLQFSSINTPLSIMREQAALLGQKSKNIVKAEVIADNSIRRLPKEKEPSDVLGGLTSFPLARPFTSKYEFVFRFYIVAPTLGNYHYRLFTAGHSIDLYPVELLLDSEIEEELLGPAPSDDEVLADTVDHFIRLLRFVLGSKKTRQIITVLMAQASEGPNEDNS